MTGGTIPWDASQREEDRDQMLGALEVALRWLTTVCRVGYFQEARARIALIAECTWRSPRLSKEDVHPTDTRPANNSPYCASPQLFQPRNPSLAHPKHLTPVSNAWKKSSSE